MYEEGRIVVEKGEEKEEERIQAEHMPAEYHKCGLKEGYCKTLEEFTQLDRHKKGMSWLRIITENKHEQNKRDIKKIGVVYKRNTKDRGIIFNYCPFCGEDLRIFRADYVKAK